MLQSTKKENNGRVAQKPKPRVKESIPLIILPTQVAQQLKVFTFLLKVMAANFMPSESVK